MLVETSIRSKEIILSE